MFYEKCGECGKEFSSEYKGLVKSNLTKHLKKYHNIDIYGYILKNVYNNQVPFCECGCGFQKREV